MASASTLRAKMANCTCTEGHSHRQPHRALPLTYEQFCFANAVGKDEGEISLCDIRSAGLRGVAQRRGYRDRRDPKPWPCAHDDSG
jgi:hypothetical protein